MKTKTLTTSAILISISIILSRLPLMQLPFGGSITFLSMFPLVLVGYFYGLKQGLLAGLIFGTINFLLTPTHYILHPIQFLLDYFLAFMALGLSGMFTNNKSKFSLEFAYTTAVLSRFIFSCISGYVFFSTYAPEGMNPIWYTLTYNASYIFPEMILTLFLMQLIKRGLFKFKETQYSL